MDFFTEQEGAYTVIRPDGDITTSVSKSFEKLIVEEIKKVHRVIADFSLVGYICSAGLRALLAAQQEADALDDGELILKNAGQEVMNVLDSTGFSNLLTIR